MDNLWPPGLIERAMAEAGEYFFETAAGANPSEREPRDRAGRPWGNRFERSNNSWVAMPYFHPEDGHGGSAGMALNEIALHPRALAAAAQLMRTAIADVRVSQDVVRPRWGLDGTGSLPGKDGTGMHVDYGNNSLVVPPRAEALGPD